MEFFDRKRETGRRTGWSPNREAAQQSGRKAEVPLYSCYYCYYDDDVIQTNCFSSSVIYFRLSF